MPFAWVDAMDEERLTVFLAQTQPDTAKSTDPDLWWSLRRPMGNTPAGERVVYSPYSGAYFRTFYAQLFMDTPRMGPDNPSERGFPARTTTDFGKTADGMPRCTETERSTIPTVYPPRGDRLAPDGLPVTFRLRRARGLSHHPTYSRAQRPEDEPNPGGTSPDDGDGTVAVYGAAGARCSIKEQWRCCGTPGT